MTELCDYFKIWFPQVANLHDPDDKGKIIKHQTSSNQVSSLIEEFLNKKTCLRFLDKAG